MKSWMRSCVAVGLLSLGGCSFEAQDGRLVGFVVNGLTAEPISLFKGSGEKKNISDDGNSTSQVWAIINGEFRRARPCHSGDLNNQNAIVADGCYQIEGIPEGMDFPIFAQVEGFARFHGQVSYPVLDVDLEKAQLVGNIRLFPLGFAVDYRIQVSYAGRPVPQVKVNCQYRSSLGNALSTAGTFLSPQDTTSGGASATTDDSGVAVISGAQLVNGAPYHCEAVPSQTLDGRVLSGELDLVAGVSQANQQLSLSAGSTVDSSFYAVSSNVDAVDVPQGANGKLTITFNRPVQLMAGTEDCQTASLFTSDYDGDGNTGSFAVDVSGNRVSETVDASLSADGLTLTLSFRAPTRPLDPDDRGTAVQFNGIVLQPRGVDSRQVRYIGSIASCPQAFAYGTQSPLDNMRTGTQSSMVLLF